MSRFFPAPAAAPCAAVLAAGCGLLWALPLGGSTLGSMGRQIFLNPEQLVENFSCLLRITQLCCGGTRHRHLPKYGEKLVSMRIKERKVVGFEDILGMFSLAVLGQGGVCFHMDVSVVRVSESPLLPPAAVTSNIP